MGSPGALPAICDYFAICVFSFCNPGPFRVLHELVGPDLKKKYVSPGPYLDKLCPRLTCDRVRSWRPSYPIGWMWPMA